MREEVSGGYLIVKPAAREPWMSAALVPEHVVSASGCIVAPVPDTWALAWTGDSMSDRFKPAAAFGLDEAGLAEVMSWSTRTFEDGVLGYPGVFFEVDRAHDFLGLFPEVARRSVVIGLALPRLGPSSTRHE